MKFYTYAFVLLFASLSAFGIIKSSEQSYVSSQNDATFSSHLIVKVPGLTLEQYNKVAAAYLKRADIEIAYFCLEAGIIALHYSHAGLSDADLKVSVKTDLKRMIKNANITILDVETKSSDADSRC